MECLQCSIVLCVYVCVCVCLFIEIASCIENHDEISPVSCISSWPFAFTQFDPSTLFFICSMHVGQDIPHGSLRSTVPSGCHGNVVSQPTCIVRAAQGVCEPLRTGRQTDVSLQQEI